MLFKKFDKICCIIVINQFYESGFKQKIHAKVIWLSTETVNKDIYMRVIQ